MSKFNMIMILIWGVLALLSFVSAFFAPLFFKIVGICFGTLNMLTILTAVIAYFQNVYYNNKLEKEFEDVQLQESEETTQEERGE